MTKRLAILAALLLAGTAAYAQNASISVFATQIRGGATSNNGSSVDADYGAGAEYWFTPRVSAAVNVSRHSEFAPTTTFSDTGFPVTTFRHVNEYPIDALVRYRFSGSEHWKPYIGGGMRGLRAFSLFGSRSWRVTPQLNGGVTFLVNQRLGIDFDGRVATNQPRYSGVDQFRASVGLSWRF